MNCLNLDQRHVRGRIDQLVGLGGLESHWISKPCDAIFSIKKQGHVNFRNCFETTKNLLFDCLA